jgi:glycosyltransferase involved in cell wall biosynthesis
MRIVSARPLMPLYQVDLLIDALAILHGRGVRFECEILGDGPERKRLTRRAEQSGLAGAVRFLGNVDSAVVEERVARADISVSLSSRDGASLAVLEAMALGTVAVLSEIPANRPWATPEGAVLVGRGAGEVADGISRAAGLNREAAIRHNRRLVLERADRETNLGRFDGVMDELVARKRFSEVLD